MKKILSTIFLAILLFTCLAQTVCAEVPIMISEDYQTLTMDGKSYSRINAMNLSVEYYEEIHKKVKLSDTQAEQIQDIYLEANETKSVLYAVLTFLDGATLSIDFLQTDYLDEYNNIMKGKVKNYNIDFEWPEGNVVNATCEELLGDDVTLKATELEFCDYYYVNAQSKDAGITVFTGALISIDSSFYYVDFGEVQVSAWSEFEPYTYAELSAYKITNETLISKLEDAETSYYADELGFLFDDSLSELVASVFLVLVFVLVPFVLLVLFLILAIRSKTIYKKMFRIIYILSGILLVIVALVTTSIFL